jgi:hypothetical protein
LSGHADAVFDAGVLAVVFDFLVAVAGVEGYGFGLFDACFEDADGESQFHCPTFQFFQDGDSESAASGIGSDIHSLDFYFVVAVFFEGSDSDGFAV